MSTKHLFQESCNVMVSENSDPAVRGVGKPGEDRENSWLWCEQWTVSGFLLPGASGRVNYSTDLTSSHRHSWLWIRHESCSVLLRGVTTFNINFYRLCSFPSSGFVRYLNVFERRSLLISPLSCFKFTLGDTVSHDHQHNSFCNIVNTLIDIVFTVTFEQFNVSLIKIIQ